MIVCTMPKCDNTSAHSTVCDFCRKIMSTSARTKRRAEFKEVIIAKGYDPFSDLYQCFHCEEYFPLNEICPDHFPFTKGSRPDLEFDIRNAVPCCQRCNTSGAAQRKDPHEFIPLPDYE